MTMGLTFPKVLPLINSLEVINMFSVINKNYLYLALALFVITNTRAEENTVIFDSSLLLGSGEDNSAVLDSLLNEPDLQDGEYSLDVYINEKLYRRDIVVIAKKNDKTIPCFPEKYWKEIGVLDDYILNDGDASCVNIKDLNFEIDRQSLKLDLYVPQAYMESKPRGYISPDQWDFGTTAGFINYDANYFQSKQNFDFNETENSSLFASARIGANVGNWRIRSQLSYSHSDSGTTTYDNINHVRTYAKTAIPTWKSELTLGQTFTSTSQFDSVGFTGFELKSDIRMKPLSQRGYAPVITGVANSVATVTVSQRGREIYQTTVAAGPFIINDLYSTYYQGDLDVSVKEANGKVSNFTVPFNAVSSSVRPGNSNYALSGGQLRLSEISDAPYFLEGFYERGITNSVTTNSGLRISENYVSPSIGLVYGTTLGAFGLSYMYAHSDIHGNVDSGWKTGIDYSVVFDTGTSLNLGGYLFSTSGYRTLNDVAVLNSESDIYDYSDIQQSERALVNININQSLSDKGQVYLSGSHTSYGGDKDGLTQAQLGYSTSIGEVTININYAKTYQEDSFDSDDIFNVGLSIPLGGRDSLSMMSLDVTHSDDTTSYQTGLAGQIKNSENTSYGITYSEDDENKMYSLSLNHLADKASFSTTYSRSDNYKQWGASVQGGAVIHSGGINLSQKLGDSFAIIKADDAEGTSIKNTRSATIAGNGYGVVSNLSPYSVNQIALDTSTMESKDVELSESEFRLIPTAGSILNYEVKTRFGKAVLVNINSNKRPPLGTEITNQAGLKVGMVSQNSLAFIRVAEPEGSLYMSWGESEDKKCVLEYDISNKIKNDVDLVRLSSVCK